MDLETENRIASILLKEAAELQRQAQKEGALAYLRQPTVRSKPNSRFLTATVRGVQQANRVVEMNEMWRIREKQIELDNRIKSTRDGKSFLESCRNRINRNRDMDTTVQNFDQTEDEGLRDDEVEKFLNSRIKRGRGAVGSRMDETGPYLPSHPDTETNRSKIPDDNGLRHRIVLGPSRPSSQEHGISSDDEYVRDKMTKKNKRKMDSGKHHRSMKHKPKRNSRDMKEHKRSKHH